MARFVIIEEKDGDIFTNEGNDLKFMVDTLWIEWDSLSKRDKKHYTRFELISSVNPDTEAVDHLDGEVLINVLEASRED